MLTFFLSERSPKLPTGWFNWIVPFYRIPDTHVLNHSSLDGYLFLRFLKILSVICFVGVCITWPILLPIHATGGGGLAQLDRLSFGNVVHSNRFWAHAMVLWVYFGMIDIPRSVADHSGSDCHDRFCVIHGVTGMYILYPSSPGLSAFSILRQTLIVEDSYVYQHTKRVS